MSNVQQIIPISHLRMEQNEILAMIDRAPVILMQKHEPCAVMVSVEQWDASANQICSMQRCTTGIKHDD